MIFSTGETRRMRDYDLELAVLEAVTSEFAPGRSWSTCELAEVMGVSRQAVRHVERRGLRKLQSLLATQKEMLSCR